MNDIEVPINDVLISYPHCTYSIKDTYIKIFYDGTEIGCYKYNGIFLHLVRFKEGYKIIIRNILDEVNNELIRANNNSEQLTNPPRYATQSGKQLIELLRDDLLTKEEYIGFLKGNLYKYVFRYQSKGGLDDLKKAQYYLEELQKIVGELDE